MIPTIGPEADATTVAVVEPSTVTAGTIKTSVDPSATRTVTWIRADSADGVGLWTWTVT